LLTARCGGYFVDLYVRESNVRAIDMYKKLGYIVYRRVLGYYSASTTEKDEDAFDMRKALPRDVCKQSMVPCVRPVAASDVT